MQNDGMATSITIRDVPDDVHDELASRAGRTGRSLQEYLRAELIDLAHRPSPEALMARVSARKRATGSKLSRSEILRLRDQDRR